MAEAVPLAAAMVPAAAAVFRHLLEAAVAAGLRLVAAAVPRQQRWSCGVESLQQQQKILLLLL